ncbi:LIC11966 family surface protein [Leptospira kmetyi]|uniref:LIC11966 family surface protein n=1 Tax=Leptospira kmetyi TaxID=408139 RepID=UPI00269F7622
MLSKNARKNGTPLWIGIFLVLCCGCKQDPIEYNHRILLVMDGIFEDARSIDLALEEENFSDAKVKTSAWEKKIKTAKESLRRIGSFRGNSSLKNASDFTLDIFSDHLIVYYKRLISLLERNNPPDSQEVYDTYYKIHLRMDEADKTFKEASEKFRMDFYE